MAISPIPESGNFLREQRRRQIEKTRQHFRFTTGRKFGDIAEKKLFEEIVPIEAAEKQAQRRFVLERKRIEEEARQRALDRDVQLQQQRETRKSQEKSIVSQIFSFLK